MKTLAIAYSPPDMDRARFSELIRDQHQPLLAYARVLAGHPGRARELVQDAFVAAWQAKGPDEAFLKQIEAAVDAGPENSSSTAQLRSRRHRRWPRAGSRRGDLVATV